jgi:hypothetical protein
MTTIRVETERDEGSGLWRLAIHLPADSEAPFVTTAPRYASAEAAANDVVAAIAAFANRAKPA